jgi:hypothetical protein
MGNRIVISESQYSRLFLNEQNDDYEKDLEEEKKRLSTEFKNMTKIEKMRYIFPDLYNNGWGDEMFWSVTYDLLTPKLQKIIDYGQDLSNDYITHNPNSKDGKEFELFIRDIATPEEWMKIYPKTMGNIFDPKNDKENFKDIKKNWGDATALEIEMFMMGANSIEDFKGDMSVEAKKVKGEYDYWEKYYDDISDKQQEEENIRRVEDAEERHKLEVELGEYDYNSPYYIAPWKKMGFKDEAEYYRWWNDEGEYSYAAAIKSIPSLVAKGIYNIFECGELEGIDYFHCIMGNASIAVSLVPILGQIGSAIIDAVDAVVYIGEASVESHIGTFYLLTGDIDKAKEHQKEALIKLGWAGLSALGIIPGVTEARAVFRAGPKVLKSSDNIVKELAKKNVKKMDPKEFDEIVTRNTKDLNKHDKKRVKDVMDELSNTKIKDELIDVQKAVVNFNKFSDEFMKANKLTQYQYSAFINSKSFKKLMNKHGGDFYKAIKDKTIRDVVTTFLLQAGITTGIVVGVDQLEKTKEERLKKDAAAGNIASMVKLEGYDWPTTRDVVFMSDKTQPENEKLKQAWMKGWRPWPKGEEPTEENIFKTGIQWLLNNPYYQTEKFKEQFKGYGGNDERQIAPEDPNERKEGVMYYRDQNHLDAFENVDDDITDEELDKAANALKAFIPA